MAIGKLGVKKERLVAKNGKQVAKEGSLEMGGWLQSGDGWLSMG